MSTQQQVVNTTPAIPAGTPVIKDWSYDPTWWPSPVQGQLNWINAMSQFPPQAGLV